MQNIFKTLTVLLVVFFVSCKPESKIKPDAIKNIPSNIIVKEKSVSGNFDSVIYDMTLFPSSDSVFYDSIYFRNIGTIPFNFSHFDQHKFIYFGDPTIIDSDSFYFTITFDDDNRINNIVDLYSTNHRYAFPEISRQATFHYNIENKINSFIYGYGSSIGSCNIYTTGSNGIYYTNHQGNDSLVIFTDVASCNIGAFEYDTIIVNYLSKNNNTNELYLSYPTIPSRTSFTAEYNLFFLQYVPFPKVNGKLIESVYFNKTQQPFTPIKYNYSYTFDANNRVKTAKIYYFDKAKEELIEFNY